MNTFTYTVYRMPYLYLHYQYVLKVQHRRFICLQCRCPSTVAIHYKWGSVWIRTRIRMDLLSRLDTDPGGFMTQKIRKKWGNSMFWKNLISFNCKILNISGHQTMDESGITLKKCWIRITMNLMRILNTDLDQFKRKYSTKFYQHVINQCKGSEPLLMRVQLWFFK